MVQNNRRIRYALSFILFFSFFCILKSEESVHEGDPTVLLLAYYENLCNEGFVRSENLKKLAQSSELINPIMQHEADVSSSCFIHFSQLNEMLTSSPIDFDVSMIRQWSIKKLRELALHERHKDDIAYKTKELYRAMNFVNIPAGKYINPLTGEEFILDGSAEIQETPVTQYQWTTVVRRNPSANVNGMDSEDVVIDRMSVRMRPNAPVESVSREDIRLFVRLLQGQDDDYLYTLPSVNEFVAVECAQGDNGNLGNVVNLNGQRVEGLTNAVFQHTRDFYSTGTLLFGMPFLLDKNNSTFKEFFRPLYSDKTVCKTVGLRLVRYKKNVANSRQAFPKFYDPKDLVWDEAKALPGDVWEWESKAQSLLHGKEQLEWLLYHSGSFDKDTQHTLFALQFQTDHSRNDIIATRLLSQRNLNLDSLEVIELEPLKFLKNLNYLSLQRNKIEDISPLKKLTQLIDLKLHNNNISDMSVLGNMVNLERLCLSGNTISDISALRNLTRLTSLNLADNNIEDISPISSLTNLKHLSLAGNPISFVSLKHLSSLREVNVDQGQANRLNLKAMFNDKVIIVIQPVKYAFLNHFIRDLLCLIHSTFLRKLFCC